MSTDPRDRPADLEPDTDPIEPDAPDHSDGPEPVLVDEPVTPDFANSTVKDDDVSLPGNATGPAPGEPLASAIDGASRPDKVAIGLMAGVVVLLLICVAFGFVAR